MVEASSEGGWSPDWLAEPMVSEYEIQRLRAIVANERGLLNLNLIAHTQVSSSIPLRAERAGTSKPPTHMHIALTH